MHYQVVRLNKSRINNYDNLDNNDNNDNNDNFSQTFPMAEPNYYNIEHELDSVFRYCTRFRDSTSF